MSPTTLWLIWLVMGVVIGLGIGQLAQTRGRSFGLWAALGMLSWVVALVVLLLMPARERHVVACRSCGQEHRPGALHCTACGRELAWD